MNPNESVAHADNRVLDRVSRLLRVAAQDPTLELELRLGTYRHGTFAPGVSRSHLDRLVQSLDKLCATEDGTMRPVHDAWVEQEDYHHFAGERAQQNEQKLRTRITYDSDEMKPETVHKTRVDSVVLCTRVMDVRIALSKETRVETPTDIVPTTHVRIKQRRSYVATRTPFLFECSFVHSGTTKTEAEASQMSREPVFEVECELMPETRQQWLRDRGERRAAKSLLTKAANLMLSSGIYFEDAEDTRRACEAARREDAEADEQQEGKKSAAPKRQGKRRRA